MAVVLVVDRLWVISPCCIVHELQMWQMISPNFLSMR